MRQLNQVFRNDNNYYYYYYYQYRNSDNSRVLLIRNWFTSYSAQRNSDDVMYGLHVQKCKSGSDIGESTGTFPLRYIPPRTYFWNIRETFPPIPSAVLTKGYVALFNHPEKRRPS